MRPFAFPNETGLDQSSNVPPTPAPPITPGAPTDNGKGKARDFSGTMAMASPLPQTPDADDDDVGAGGKGEKKKKNTYKHLIKGIPGAS